MVAQHVLVAFVLAWIPAAPALALAQQAPWIAIEEAEIVASDAGQGDAFGGSVALDGDTALIGAYSVDNGNGMEAGAAYVFVRDGATWTEQQRLLGGPGLNSFFGWSTALSGDTAVIGATGDDSAGPSNAGAVYVFVRSGTAWSLQQKLTASNATTFDNFGFSVAISGETLVVGAHHAGSGANENGAVYVFVRNGTTWTEQQVLKASDGFEFAQFGSSVAIEGDTVIVGSDQDTHPGGSGAGSAYVFVRSGTTWTEHQKLTASNADDGDEFGLSVAMSGDTALVGAPRNDHSGQLEAGAVYVFGRNGTIWTEQQVIIASDPGLVDQFGNAVAISGDLAVLGAWFDEVDGAAYLFARSQAIWSEQQKIIPDEANSGLFGHSVAVSGNTALVGASQSNGGEVFQAGVGHVYGLFPEYESYCTAGTSASGCQALVSAAGTASATAPSGFTLLGDTVEGQKDGLFYFGTNGKQAKPWGNGTSLQCVVPPTKRAGLLAGTGSVGACDGAFSQDLNATWCPACPKSVLNPGAGAVVQAQLWYRDPFNTSNQSTSLSDAIEFAVGP